MGRWWEEEDGSRFERESSESCLYSSHNRHPHALPNPKNSFDDDDAGGGRAGGGYTFHLRAFGLQWRAAVLEAAGRIIAQVCT